MNLYPVNLKLAGRQCIVVGGGKVAARKVVDLLECGAAVRVISPELGEGFQGLAGFVHEPRGYHEGDLEGAFLAIAATDDEAVNAAVVAEAASRGVILNVVDQPGRCDFQVPASVRRGELLITVSSGGRLPALSKRLRQQLEDEFPAEWGRVLELLGDARARVIAGVGDEQRKRRCLTELAGLDLVGSLRQGGEDAVTREIDNCISRY
ncbi:MAG: precorrin-2 dehydrogenase/sirohydrochlorin ferrochelatase family protein [Thermoleophilia bacterium]